MSFSVTSERTENRRNLKRVLLAIAVVMCMSAVPFAVSSESDALTAGSDGYVLRIGAEATGDELSNVGMDEFDFGMSYWMSIFSDMGFREPGNLPNNINIGSHSLNDAVGNSISGNTSNYVDACEFDYKNAKFTYNSASGNILDSVFAEKYPDFASAVTTYLGKSAYEAGDVVVISGNMSGSSALKTSYQWADVNDTQVVSTGYSIVSGQISKADVTYTINPDTENQKTITFKIDSKSYGNAKVSITYDKKISELVDGDTCHYNFDSTETSYSGSTTASVNGTEYALGEYIRQATPSDGTATVVEKEDLIVDDYSSFLKGKSATDHVSFDIGYGAAEKMANKVFDDAKGGTDFIKYILIAGAVAAIAILAVLAFFVLRKKKA